MSSIALIVIAAHACGDFILQTNWQAKHKMAAGWPESEDVTEATPWGSGTWVRRYSRFDREAKAAGVRLLHVALYTLAFAPVPIVAGMSTSRGLLFLAAVFAPHFVVDCRRWASAEPWPPKPILVDQSIHAACLAAVAVAFGL